MSRIIIKHPTTDAVNTWGILAHVNEVERKRILDLPSGKFGPEIKILEREVDLAKFPRKKKSIVKEYYGNTNFKQQPNKEQNYESESSDDDIPF